MAKLDVSTPSPSTLHTPKTPQHSAYDYFCPNFPRRSVRIAQRYNCNKNSGSSLYSPSIPRKNIQHDPNHKKSVLPVKLSPITPQSKSKHSKKYTHEKYGRPTPGVRVVSPDVKQSSDLKISSDIERNPFDSSSTTHGNGMLPTPAKTPSKKPHSVSKSITSIARNLFPDQSVRTEELVKSKGRRHHRISKTVSEGLSTDDDYKSFTIYTDFPDRIPEKEICLDNPFYLDSNKKRPVQVRRNNRRKEFMVPGEGLQSFEDVIKRTDGVISCFRGVSVFQKYDDHSESFTDESDNEGECSNVASGSHKPLTRSSIKPRLLFPVGQKHKIRDSLSHDTEDEEADTDIENPLPTTPKSFFKSETMTPKASIFVPVSPPTTTRASRSKRHDMTKPPVTPTNDEKNWTPSPITRVSRHGSDDKRCHSYQRSESTVEKHFGKRPCEQIIKSGTNKKFRLR